MLKSLLFSLLFTSSVSAAEVLVHDSKSLEEALKKSEPGDTVVLKNGEWVDAKLKIRGKGTSEKPITIKAETPGEVIFTGDSRIGLAGEHLIVDGLQFRNPESDETISFRVDSKELARDCRVTNCSVTSLKSDFKTKNSQWYVSIYGSRNRLDHCYLAGKETEGATLVVWLAEGIEASHRIDHNYFGPRPRLGKNGGETIRVGDSKTSMFEANCVVEHNLFEECDGEAECISNKSCGNLYRNNHFQRVSGTLTLRHGNACRVENNVFTGEGVKGSGGVRIIGEGHVITGNQFIGLAGDDERSAMCFMLGIPDSPANGYFQVKRATVTGNTFVDCEENIVIGMSGDKKATLPPIETTIHGNYIQTNQGKAFDIRCDTSGIELDDNQQGKEPPKSIGEPIKLEKAGPEWRK